MTRVRVESFTISLDVYGAGPNQDLSNPLGVREADLRQWLFHTRTVQQCLRAGLIDEMHFAISPVLLGEGERLFEAVDTRALGSECVQCVASEKATHVVLRRNVRTDA